jgi:hypothetical protein
MNNVDKKEVNTEIQVCAIDGATRRPWNSPKLGQPWHTPGLTQFQVSSHTLNGSNRYDAGDHLNYLTS